MKLWRLIVALVLGSDGEQERRMLRAFAEELKEPGTRVLYGEHGKARYAFAITDDDTTARSIVEAWEREYGDPAGGEGVPMLGCDRVAPGSDASSLARYYGVKKRALEKQLEKCYGVRSVPAVVIDGAKLRSHSVSLETVERLAAEAGLDDLQPTPPEELRLDELAKKPSGILPEAKNGMGIDIGVHLDMGPLEEAVGKAERLVELLEYAGDLVERLAKRLGSE